MRHEARTQRVSCFILELNIIQGESIVMRDYPIELYGIAIYESDINAYCEKEDISKEDFIDKVSALVSLEGPDIEGDAYSLLDDEAFDLENTIAIGILEKVPRLTKAAYSSLDEAVEEAQKNFEEFLPNDFPYKERLIRFFGTVFG